MKKKKKKKLITNHNFFLVQHKRSPLSHSTKLIDYNFYFFFFPFYSDFVCETVCVQQHHQTNKTKQNIHITK